MDWIFPAYNYTERRLVNFRVRDIFTGSYKTAFNEFITFYAPDVIAPYALTYPRLKERRLRICRFCKKSAPEVTFKKVAHVIPEFLGNKYLVHDIECDACNLKFAKYEDSFANSLGLLRTADGIRGKKGIPKFKDKGLIAFAEKNENGEHAIILQSLTAGNTKYDEESKTITLQATKAPYVPLHVMKTLFKIGYSVLLEGELSEYSHLDKIINTSTFDDKLQQYCKVLVCTFPHHVGNPFVVTFKKRTEFRAINIPSKIVLLYFGRFMYEFVLLNSSDDFMIKKEGQGKIIYAPSYWDEANGEAVYRTVDFSSSEVLRETEELVFTFETEPIVKEL